MRSTLLAAFVALGCWTASAAHCFAGVIETIATFINSDPDKILLNRHNEVLTGYNQPFDAGPLLYYTPGQPLLALPIAAPNGYWSFNWSNWGAVSRIYRQGQPMQVARAPVAVAPIPFFTGVKGGSIGEPAINDDGVIAFGDRSTVQTGLIRLWRAEPGQTPEQLPDLLGAEFLDAATSVDREGRVTTAAIISGATVSVQLQRYAPTTGWENITPSGAARITGTLGIWDANPDGQLLVPMETDTGGQRHYWASFYDPSTGELQNLVDLTPDGPGGTAPRPNKTALADNGAALVLVGSSVVAPWNGFYRRPDGSVLSIDSMLPPGQQLSFNTLTVMNSNGELFVEAEDAVTQARTYYYFFDGQTLTPVLENLPFRHSLALPELGNDRRAYFWRRTAEGADSWILGTVAVPEPAGLIQLAGGLVILCCLAICRRRRILARLGSTAASNGTRS